MKKLRQYIRQILLTEAMIKANDLPDDVTVYIQDIEGDASHFSIFYKTPEIPYPIGEIRITTQSSCDGAMKVVDVHSDLENGGPLLYDLAIEVATINANGLTADRDYVDPAAESVWDFYLKNRPDVESFPLDPALCPAEYSIEEWQTSPLSRRFTKQPTSIRALKNLGKLATTGQILLEKASFRTKGDSNYFRVDLPGIGYAQGGENLRFKECQADVDAIMRMPEYIEAEKRYQANAKPRTDIVRNEETGKYEEVEIGPAKFRPRFFDVENAWITNPENRGKGHGKEIYKAFINQAAEYSQRHGGVFVGAHKCVMGSGTSPAAQRVWNSLGRDYTSSGLVIFIGL